MHPLTCFSEAQDIPLSHLAERVGVHPSTLSRLVKLQRRPSAQLIARIVAETGGLVTAQALVEAHASPVALSVCLAGKNCNDAVIKYGAP